MHTLLPKKEFGYDQGFMSAWFLVLVYMAIVWANATAIPIICRKLFPGFLEIGPYYTVAGFDVYVVESLVSSAMIVIAAMICIFGGKITARIQFILAVILIGGIVFGTANVFLVKGNLFDNIQPQFSQDGSNVRNVIQIVASGHLHLCDTKR